MTCRRSGQEKRPTRHTSFFQDPPYLEDELEVASVIYSPEMLLHDYDLPFNECVALKNHAEAQHYGRDILLTAIWALTKGGKKYPVGKKMRELVWIWANAGLRVDDAARGRPETSEKAHAVYVAYGRKRNAEPNRKDDSIIKELEQEFGLKERRIRAMLAVYRDMEADSRKD